MGAGSTVIVVMAGGKGTRFWPRSRERRPKQFLPILGERNLLAQTVDRVLPTFGPERIFIATTTELAEETRRLLPELPPDNVIAEPEGRNTAPCLALALVHIARKRPDAVMAVLSADHWIGDEPRFLEDLDLAARHAAGTGDLVTFGIPPAYPETGYGYIETEGEGPVRRVAAFREKPPLETALAYAASGRHFWNAGMFVWRLDAFREELRAHAPAVLDPLEAWASAGALPGDLPAAYARTEATSIDYALLERSRRVAAIPARFRWSDVGSWPALLDFHEKDAAGNIVRGDAVLVEARDCAVFGGARLVALAGVEDLIVVDEPDALLVTRRDRAQGVKQVVDELKRRGRKDLL
ncbi:MAG: mannose-1-phosphate guanylyltransferase [Acidobacteria bacterium]|nr:mannose-1-phosphate guanylyltransferase [Acidobacteriota bacterium]